MQYVQQIVLFSFILLSFIACDEVTDSDPEMLEFQTETTSHLSEIIENNPSDFTWNHFNNNIEVSMMPGSEWSGELVLSSFMVQDGDVVERTSSDAVVTNAEELESGISSEELFPGSQWMSGNDWVPGNSWFPGSQWVPTSTWAPVEVESMAMSEHTLSDNEVLVVVYAEVAGNPESDQITRPFGLIFERKPLEFAVTSNEDLSFIINNAPSDFNWPYFQDNLLVNLIPGANWSGDISLSAFQIRNGEVINSHSSGAISTNSDELTDGVTTEDLIPGMEWVPGSMWVPGSDWVPGDEWLPSSNWAPEEIESNAISNTVLGSNQTMVVVYVQLAGSSGIPISCQPYGVIFNQN